nr:GRIP and coiled-coil domain-containing protein 2-like [Nicotiana tomentosiformis]
MIREARALKTLFVEEGHRREDPFCDNFTGVEDATRLSDLEVSSKNSSEASGLFNEVQQALNRASELHREAFSRSRAELSRCEADLRGLTEDRNALKLLCRQREEEIKDLRAELAKAHQDQSDLIEQQKIEVIGKLREEVDTMKAETLGWKEGMDRFAADTETALSQLSSAKSQL